MQKVPTGSCLNFGFPLPNVGEGMGERGISTILNTPYSRMNILGGDFRFRGFRNRVIATRYHSIGAGFSFKF